MPPLITAPWDLEVSLSDYKAVRVVPCAPSGELKHGEVRLDIERLAISANNLTYAVLGERMGYWKLFPAAPGWGRIPAWGYGVVTQSAHGEIGVGERFFGLFPMSTQVVMAARRSRVGIADTGAHRAALNPVYNQYAATTEKNVRALESNALFRPLVITSFVLALYLREHACFGADTVIITSASSKTALGLAVLLKGQARVTALTSSGNRAFVDETGCYEQSLGYGELAGLQALGTCVIVDFSGDADLLARADDELGQRLLKVIRVGGTHWETSDWEAPAPGDEKSEVFFGPSHIQRHVAAWTAPVFEQRFAAALDQFGKAAAPWFTTAYADHAPGLVGALETLTQGRLAPSNVLIARPGGPLD